MGAIDDAASAAQAQQAENDAQRKAMAQARIEETKNAQQKAIDDAVAQGAPKDVLADAQTKAAVSDAQSADQQAQLAKARLAETFARNATASPENLTPNQAATLGQSGSDTAVPVGETMESTGHVKPSVAGGSSTTTPQPPTSQPIITSVGQVVGSYGPETVTTPTIKDMVAKIISSGEQGRLAGEMTPAAATTTEQERLAGEVTPAAGTKDAKSDFDWVGMLKKLGNAGAAGLSRWGKDLMGAPEAQTPWEVEQAQTFETAKAKQAQEAELQRTAAVAQIQAQQAAVENQYQMQRMNLQNQMNVANIPIEAKSELAKQMAVLDQQHKNDVDLMEKNYGVYFAKLGVQPGADPGIHFGGG